ncbi:hypothetical protein [Mitsuaria sp. GD03876]|uniref:hypothetical protein n=1 Tax=Mitsuaria sp. GD03876 TaxID=2975399 RepID=UPI00244CFF6D|nr:hypothetical protein [Mitsuaria sp. GD03876]MDH0864396.1 hypothetical protein [Mitsuaria sp. GD03876]
MNKHSVLAAVVLAVAASQGVQAQTVVVGHPGAEALSNAQIVDVYLGKSQAATPLDLPESASTRTAFYQSATGKDLAQVKSLWARLIFTGVAKPPKVLADAAAVKKEVAANPKAIGYIDKSAVDGSVKVLATFN